MFLAVIGDPIAHSLSPAIHTAVFAELGLPLRYEKYRVEKGCLPDWLPTVSAEGIDGFNVTMPHKRDIAAVCGVTGDAASAGVPRESVNTVRVEQDGSMSGFSTDEGGFLLSLSELGFDVAGKNAVIVGQGGVAQTLSAALSPLAKTVTCVSARSNGANRRAEGVTPYVDWRASLQDTDLLINATPLGMEGVSDTWLDLSFLRLLPKDALVYDLLYRPPVTPLLQAAAELGLQTQNGLAMLIYQAILSDEIYLRRTLDVTALKKAAAARTLAAL